MTHMALTDVSHVSIRKVIRPKLPEKFYIALSRQMGKCLVLRGVFSSYTDRNDVEEDRSR